MTIIGIIIDHPIIIIMVVVGIIDNNNNSSSSKTGRKWPDRRHALLPLPVVVVVVVRTHQLPLWMAVLGWHNVERSWKKDTKRIVWIWNSAKESTRKKSALGARVSLMLSR
jgi:hypothetical protein